MSGVEQCPEVDRRQSSEGVLALAAVVGRLSPVTIASCISVRVVQRRWLSTFFCSKLKRDFMAALSA